MDTIFRRNISIRRRSEISDPEENATDEIMNEVIEEEEEPNRGDIGEVLKACKKQKPLDENRASVEMARSATGELKLGEKRRCQGNETSH